MANKEELSSGLRHIDLERFFHVLSGRLDANDMEKIAAAMAESAVTEQGRRRVLSCSAIDPARLSPVRCRLRKELPDLERDGSCSSIRDGNSPS